MRKKESAEKKHIITIAGKPGSGKSTVADLIAETLGYSRFSSGDLMRAIARRKGLSLEELNHIAEKEGTIDDEIDEALRQIGKNNDRVIIDSRLAFHWIPDSFKVYLDLDTNTAAERIFKDTSDRRRLSGEQASSAEEIKARIEDRLTCDLRRYKKLYDVDPYDESQFDLVLDTNKHTREDAAARIVEAYKKARGL